MSFAKAKATRSQEQRVHILTHIAKKRKKSEREENKNVKRGTKSEVRRENAMRRRNKKISKNISRERKIPSQCGLYECLKIKHNTHIRREAQSERKKCNEMAKK